MGDLNRLSHFLSRILRHEAKTRGLDVSSGKISRFTWFKFLEPKVVINLILADILADIHK